MNFWLEALGIFVIPVAISALFIGVYVSFANLWQRRVQRRRAMHGPSEVMIVVKGQKH